jgi:Right handed beta helix region
LVSRLLETLRHRLLRGAVAIAAASLAALSISVATAAAVTVACGDTLTEDTVVDNDIVCAESDAVGVVIGADDITVRFGNHSISGAGAVGLGSIGITDDGVPHTGVTIRDATIGGFDTGIYLQASNSRVMGLTYIAADTGLFLVGDDNFVHTNTMRSPGTVGLDVEGDRNYLWGNRVTGLPDDGIYVSGDDPLVVRNRVSGCTFTGITVTNYTTFAKIALNIITSCDTGIWMSGSGVGAHLQSSDVSGNCDGLFVFDPTAQVLRNNAHENDCDGIAVGLAGTYLRDNRADDNGQIGIDAVEGATDGGGNTASGNPEGDCFAVVCLPALP